MLRSGGGVLRVSNIKEFGLENCMSEESGGGGGVVCPKYKYLCYTHKRYPGLTPGFVYRPYTDNMVWRGGGVSRSTCIHV